MGAHTERLGADRKGKGRIRFLLAGQHRRRAVRKGPDSLGLPLLWKRAVYTRGEPLFRRRRLRAQQQRGSAQSLAGLCICHCIALCRQGKLLGGMERAGWQVVLEKRHGRRGVRPFCRRHSQGGEAGRPFSPRFRRGNLWKGLEIYR
ncbi:hypothetical protein SDC9_161111 [bioreactor metagenome]|uniref:Uncharacterized protein n=1 Tax=bioreactor metagenome TaxID=1076179 RepID=A0A645FH86_9ZZZZ